MYVLVAESSLKRYRDGDGEIGSRKRDFGGSPNFSYIAYHELQETRRYGFKTMEIVSLFSFELRSQNISQGPLVYPIEVLSNPHPVFAGLESFTSPPR